MEQSSYNEQLLGKLVADDFRAAGIFKNAGIDFCCGGKKTLDEACREKNISPDLLVQQLNDLRKSQVAPGQNFNEWPLDFLADYIVNTHHKFVQKTLPELLFYTQKIADVHGSHHQELLKVAELFSQINTELIQHLAHEETVLFPAIREALNSNSPDARATILSEITRMNGEHEFAGGAMDDIHVLTKSYERPSDACSTYEVTLKLLSQFEDDLHIHVHLENNILFPKALRL